MVYVPRAPQPRRGPTTSVRLEYTRQKGKRLTYEIEATNFGGYTIRLNGKVIKQMHMGDHFGAPRFGSKRLQAQGIEDAKSAIESLLTDER